MIGLPIDEKDGSPRRHKPPRETRRRRLVLLSVVTVVLAVCSLSTLFPRVMLSYDIETASELAEGTMRSLVLKWLDAGRQGAWEESGEFDESSVLNYAQPQASIREQLRPGVRYLLGGSFGGQANQFIGLYHLLHVAKLTSRVAIITTLVPLHFEATPRDFSDFYDLSRFRKQSGIAAVEQSRFKAFNDSKLVAPDERISCWSLSETVAGEANPADSLAVHRVHVDYWPLPSSVPRASNEYDLSFEGMKGFEEEEMEAKEVWVDRVRHEAIPQKKGHGSRRTAHTRRTMKDGFDPFVSQPPSDALSCYDSTFFASSRTPFEDATLPREDESWRSAGQHIYFNRQVELQVNTNLKQLFGVRDISEVPHFITVHLRRTDFLSFAGETDLDLYHRAVTRVRQSLGWSLDQLQVVVTTDETSPIYLAGIERLGWKIVQHNLRDAWMGPVLDAAILARGKGFVGTKRSTFSEVAALRVKYWQDGALTLHDAHHQDEGHGHYSCCSRRVDAFCEYAFSFFVIINKPCKRYSTPETHVQRRKEATAWIRCMDQSCGVVR